MGISSEFHNTIFSTVKKIFFKNEKKIDIFVFVDIWNI